jgi:predicted nucleic acid-binding protein
VTLIDSSVWIDHLRAPNETLSALIERREVLTHPFVIGEIALGAIRSRAAVLAALDELPSVPVARDDDVLYLIEQHQLFGRGVGYIDAHLIAATRLRPGTKLWTRDRRLLAVANQFALSAHFTH